MVTRTSECPKSWAIVKASHSASGKRVQPLLGGVAASQYVQTIDSPLSYARPPAAGSSNHIQNTTSQQPNSGFKIRGNGAIGAPSMWIMLMATTGMLAAIAQLTLNQLSRVRM